MRQYTITLNSGRQLTGLRLNGSMYVSQEELTTEDLNPDELSQVTILEQPENGEATEETRENQVCDGVQHWPDGYIFNIRDMTPSETAMAELDARIAFLEMMGGYDE